MTDAGAPSIDGWLTAMEALLASWHPTPGCENALDRLLDAAPAVTEPTAADVDPAVVARVVGGLRAQLDETAAELAEVRERRRQLTRAGAGHAGYAASLNAADDVPIGG